MYHAEVVFFCQMYHAEVVSFCQMYHAEVVSFCQMYHAEVVSLRQMYHAEVVTFRLEVVTFLLKIPPWRFLYNISVTTLPFLLDKSKIAELMNLQTCMGMSNRRIQLAISSIIYRTHFSHKDKSQLLFIPQTKLSILSQPLHILLAEEMMEQKSCRKLIRFMVRSKSWCVVIQPKSI